MNDQDRPKFAMLMKGLCEAYDKLASKERTEIYFRVLEDLTIAQVEEGVYRCLRERTITSTLPVPGEIRQHLSGGKTAALLALDKAEQAISRYGVYRSVVFDDPVIHMVIASMGGWHKFCAPWSFGDDREWHWKQKEFCALYETFAKSPRAECPLRLVGLNEASQVEWGMEPKPPEIVGVKQKALAWTSAAKDEKRLPPGGPGKVKELVGAVAGKMEIPDAETA